MKKIIAILALCVLMLTVFVGCNPSTCEECGKTDVSTSEFEFDGEAKYLCDDCYKIAEGLSALSGALK